LDPRTIREAGSASRFGSANYSRQVYLRTIPPPPLSPSSALSPAAPALSPTVPLSLPRLIAYTPPPSLPTSILTPTFILNITSHFQVPTSLLSSFPPSSSFLAPLPPLCLQPVKIYLPSFPATSILHTSAPHTPFANMSAKASNGASSLMPRCPRSGEAVLGCRSRLFPEVWHLSLYLMVPLPPLPDASVRSELTLRYFRAPIPLASMGACRVSLPRRLRNVGLQAGTMAPRPVPRL